MKNSTTNSCDSNRCPSRAVIRHRRRGLSAFWKVNNRPRGFKSRGKVPYRGWTAKSLAANRNFLQSFDERELAGHMGVWLTLTVGAAEIPSPVQFSRLFDSWWRRIRKRQVRCLHWVIEFQKRGAPHLHILLYFEDTVQQSEFWERSLYLRRSWIDFMGHTGARLSGQRAVLITDYNGLLQYVEKHASKALSEVSHGHIRVPDSWQDVTGRMWGKKGRWPSPAPVVDIEVAGSALVDLALHQLKQSVVRLSHESTLPSLSETTAARKRAQIHRIRERMRTIADTRARADDWYKSVPFSRWSAVLDTSNAEAVLDRVCQLLEESYRGPELLE